MRLILAGTPEVAVPSLEAIAASRHELVAVITRPDAPSGRGRRTVRSAVGAWADDRGLPVLTPGKVSEIVPELRSLAPECVPVVAYGQLIRADALAVPPRGWVNLHFSVLPAYRGAAPVQRALLAGEEVTGASVFALDEGLDTGDVYGVMTERVRPGDTSGDLLERLSVAGASLLVRVLDGIEDGALEARPQDDAGASPAPKLTPADARIDWAAGPVAVDRRVRACTPEPGAWTTWRGERLGLGPVRRPTADEATQLPPDLSPGALAVTKRLVAVGTSNGPVLLDEVRPAGRRNMRAVDWARGVRPEAGEGFE